MAIRNWRTYLTDLLPSWLLGYYGERLTGFIGLMTDCVGTGAFEATVAPWLLEPSSPDDILSIVGNERYMQRYEGETAASYRSRLVNAWDTWTRAGNEFQLGDQLNLVPRFSGVTINKNTDWNWDGDTTYWSRFWVVLNPSAGTTFNANPKLGQPSPQLGQGGNVLGIDMSPAEVASLLLAINTFRAAHVVCQYVIIIRQPGFFYVGIPDGTWQDIRRRDAGAAYIPATEIRWIQTAF